MRAHRPDPARKPVARRGGTAFGLMVGVVIGLVIAAAVAAYLYFNPSEFKAVAPAPQPGPPPATAKPAAVPAPPPPATAPAPAPHQARDYTFYDILQGDKPGQPTPSLPREVYWLQVAALANAKEADRLKASLSLLGMDVAVQKTGGDKPLHRVRVGPFKTEDAAMSALDTLVANQFEPRLVKEAANP